MDAPRGGEYANKPKPLNDIDPWNENTIIDWNEKPLNEQRESDNNSEYEQPSQTTEIRYETPLEGTNLVEVPYICRGMNPKECFRGSYENKYDHSSCSESNHHNHIVCIICKKIAKGFAKRCECKEVSWRDSNEQMPLTQEREFQWNDPPIAVNSRKQEDTTVLEIKPRPKFVLGILYNNERIYLSKRIDSTKDMHGL